MKKELGILAAILIATSIVPIVLAVGGSIGASIGISGNLSTGNFKPNVYMNPNQRVVWDMTGLITRAKNYAFTGEKINWTVLVTDENGVTDIKDVLVTVGSNRGIGNPVEVGCNIRPNQLTDGTIVPWANDGTGPVVFNSQFMRIYVCILTVEPGMLSEYWVVAEATDQSNEKAIFDENEFWFFNPALSLSVSGAINFGQLKPGQTHYSSSNVVVTNYAEEGSGVQMNMSISGTDFFDNKNSAARCPDSNVLNLRRGAWPDNFTGFAYYATSGSYSTNTNVGKDLEGYDNIPYETGDPDDRALIIDSLPDLAQGADITLTFRLTVPSPCNGNFNNGSIYFWGQAI